MDIERMKNAMADLEEDILLEEAKLAAEEKGASLDHAVWAMQKGMETVGERFETGEYFVGDLIFAGEIMGEAMDIIKPAITDGSAAASGRIILCTVKDDLHDIGKNIVKAMLEAAGIEVLDLGVDTPAEKIVATAQAEGIRVIALSGVLTLALDSMKSVVDAFAAAGLREDVKIIIGGAPVSEEACARIGADEWAHSPQKTVDTCKAWLA